MCKQWKKEQVWPFFCCCKADSHTDAGRHQLYTNGPLVLFFPLLAYVVGDGGRWRGHLILWCYPEPDIGACSALDSYLTRKFETCPLKCRSKMSSYDGFWVQCSSSSSGKKNKFGHFLVDVKLIHRLIQADICCTTTARLFFFPLLVSHPVNKVAASLDILWQERPIVFQQLLEASHSHFRMSNRSGRSDRYDWRHTRSAVANLMRRERTSTSTKDSYLQEMRRRRINYSYDFVFLLHRWRYRAKYNVIPLNRSL